MLGRLYERENCSAARALEHIGERWSLLIIRNAVFAGMTRFSEFEQSLGIAPNVLAKRLDSFVGEKLMERRPIAASGAIEYVLTDKGRELGMVVVALTQWGDRWSAPDGPPITLEHRDCGGRVRMHTQCEHCDAEPSVEQIVAEPGPGADDEVRRKRAAGRSTKPD